MEGGETMNKYRNVPTIVDGVRFDSKAEASRYNELKLLLRAGKISDFKYTRSELTYRVVISGKKICDYIADFAYRDNATGLVVVEDVKSSITRTPVYKLKKKLVEAMHGIKIVEVMK